MQVNVYLKKKLLYPLPTKGGDVLRTVQDARDHLLTLGPQREARHHWQRACELLLAKADVVALTLQFHRALFMDSQLDLVAFESMNGPQRR
jgi:hypothetical protein